MEKKKKPTSSLSDLLSQDLIRKFPLFITLFKTDLFASTVAAARWLEFQMKLDLTALHIQVQSLSLVCS